MICLVDACIERLRVFVCRVFIVCAMSSRAFRISVLYDQ